LKTDKASKCLTHLRKCTEFKGTVPQKKRKVHAMQCADNGCNECTECNEKDELIKKLRKDIELQEEIIQILNPTLSTLLKSK